MKQIVSILPFEWKYWFKKTSVYVYFSVIMLFALLIFSIETIRIGNVTEVVYKNAPYSLTKLYILISLFLPLILNEFIAFSLARDYEYKFHEIIYTFPVSKFVLFSGRFLGAFLPVIMIFASIPLADILAHVVPWTPEDSLLPFNLTHHLWCMTIIVLPSLIAIGCILFFFGSFLKNIKYSILIAVGMLALYFSFLQLSDNLIDHSFIDIADPFGLIPLFELLNKQTAYEMNHYLIVPTARFIINRIVWCGLGIGLFFMAVYKQRIRWNLPKKTSDSNDSGKTIRSFFQVQYKSIQFSKKTEGFSWILSAVANEASLGLKYMLRSNVLIFMTGIIFLMYLMYFIGMIQDDEAPRYATTYYTLKIIFFVIFILKLFFIYLSAEIFWREKTSFFSEIKYSLPVSPAVILTGKLFSLMLLYIFCAIFFLLFGILYQTFKGEAPVEFSIYFTEIFIFKFTDFIALIILSFFLHALTGQKFISMGIVILILTFQPVLKASMHIKSNMAGILPSFPDIIYSDFYGYGPYLTQYISFWFYWMLIYAFVFYVTIVIFEGYKHISFLDKLFIIKNHFAQYKLFPTTALIIVTGYAGFLHYHVNIRNRYLSYDDEIYWRAFYEKNYQKYKDKPQPKIVYADYAIDLFGKERKYFVKAKLYLKNKFNEPIEELYINNPVKHPFEIINNNLTLIHKDTSKLVSFEIYRLKQPLMPGDSMLFEYSYKEIYESIENELSNPYLMPNGTFLNYSMFTPAFGYDESYEIAENTERKKQGLPIKQFYLPPLETNCTQKCMWNYVTQSDWAKMHFVISTYADQMAIAPGKLVKKWTTKNRAYFEYRLDQPSLFFFNVMSARYAVKKERLNDIELAIYYHPGHEWNVPQMMDALKASISYYVNHLGKYYHNEARIIEFPQFSSFAQAFPGTMPYSESIGFTSNYKDNQEDINRIFHVVAHEMAHQWWAHQVVGAKMQGAPFLSESLAEFSASNVIAKVFGEDMLLKFLRRSNRNYITSRAYETKREPTLLTTDQQSYVYYDKAAVSLNAIQHQTGFAIMFNVLQQLIKKFAYQEPPYPTSLEFSKRLYDLCPDSLKPFVQEHLEKIIIWDLDVKSKEAKPQADSTWEINLNIEFFKNSYLTNISLTENIKNTDLGKSERLVATGPVTITAYEKKKGKMYGEPLASSTIMIQNNHASIKLICPKKPDKIVIDPKFAYIWKDVEKKEITP